MDSSEDETRRVLTTPDTLAGLEPDSELERGVTIGRYVVLDAIGSGGMGQVYRAFDPELDRQVAIKLLQPGRGREQDRRLLLEEAKLMAKFTHPNVVVVHDAGEYREQVFIAMELVDGRTLRKWLHVRERSLDRILQVFREAGEGLAAAHAQGIVHLDFKPGNVMVGKHGRTRVLDFGLAAFAQRHTPATGGDASTRPMVVGTPPYMSPEQHRGESVDARADIYAYGVTLWEAVYGVRPFRGKKNAEFLAAKLAMEPRTAPDAKVPTWIHRILLRLLDPDPANRYGSMRAVLNDLAVDPVRLRRRRIGFGVAGGSLLGLGFVASSMIQTPDPDLCTRSRAAAEEFWNAEVKAGARAAFEATGRPYAAKAFDQVQAALDAFVTNWSAGRDDACADTQVRSEQSEEIMDLRIGCYDRKLADAAAFIDLLASADATVVDHAAQAAGRLPILTPCEDIASLRGRYVEPTDATSRARMEEVRTALTKIRALKAAGKVAEAREALEPAIALARQVDYPPLLAELLVDKFGGRSGEPGDKRQAGLLEAASLARRAGSPELELQAWTQLLWSAGVYERNLDLGRSYAEYATALADAVDARPSLRRDLDAGLAAYTATSGDLDRALEIQQGLVDSVEKTGAARVDLVGPLNNLGNIHSMRRDLEQANETYARVVAVAREELGDAHPTTLRVRSNVAITRAESGEGAEVLPELEDLLAAKKIIYGDEHSTVAEAYSMLGLTQLRQDRLDDARQNVQAGVDLFTKLHGERHSKLVEGYTYLALIEREAGNPDLARQHVELALEIGLETLGASNPVMAGTFATDGELRFARGDTGGAIAQLQKALDVSIAAGGEDVIAPSIRYNLARALLKQGQNDDRARARTLLQKAIEQFEKSPGPDEEEADAALGLWNELNDARGG